MKKKRNILIVIAIIAIVAAIGSTMAAFVASTTTTKDVSAAELGIKIVQNGDKDAKSVKSLEAAEGRKAGYQYAGMPGDTVRQQVAVKSDANSKDSYIRVTINRSWTDKDGKKDFKLSPKEIGIARDNDSWLVTEDPEDPEVIYCYYTRKVGGNAQTENVMDSFTILKDKVTENSNAYAGYSANITFEADAVQAEAGAKAMLAEWGIMAELDAEGNLTGYTEQ
ncbi:hypothetical protein [Eubacterium callanderi]|uniref:Alternate signal-mediated exported protein, CPF_0494 family n=1 Tax=Eubacterium callanderi TaxID=53442 RepID=A0A853JKH9_9FIRM|nr:hypothetical protein [Eubacterium callanderi]